MSCKMRLEGPIVTEWVFNESHLGALLNTRRIDASATTIFVLFKQMFFKKNSIENDPRYLDDIENVL